MDQNILIEMYIYMVQAQEASTDRFSTNIQAN